MLLTDQVRIQEVLLFPAMKPEDKVQEEKIAEHRRRPQTLTMSTICNHIRYAFPLH